MKNTRKVLLNLVSSACLTLAATAVQANEPLALQKVMKDLGNNMQIVTDGISREDWLLVEKTAQFIASHPQPPATEKIRIMSFMGANMGKFKAYDGETHDAADAMGKAAANKDGRGVINAFQKVQTACFNCHSEFRKPFVEHFYSSRRSVKKEAE